VWEEVQEQRRIGKPHGEETWRKEVIDLTYRYIL
jgi:hypothetical protein